MSKLTDAEAGYIAGFLDADGCISIHTVKKLRYKEYKYLVVTFTQNTREVLDWIQKTIGCGTVYSYRTPKGKPVYRLWVYRKEALDLIHEIEDYIIVKQDRLSLLEEFE